MTNNQERMIQTVLAIEPEKGIVFARIPTEVEVAELQRKYDEDMAELERMIPGWFLAPDQATMTQFLVTHKNNPGR